MPGAKIMGRQCDGVSIALQAVTVRDVVLQLKRAGVADKRIRQWCESNVVIENMPKNFVGQAVQIYLDRLAVQDDLRGLKK